nr:hypothetical protein [Alternaria alternata polymycovirus 2]
MSVAQRSVADWVQSTAGNNVPVAPTGYGAAMPLPTINPPRSVTSQRPAGLRMAARGAAGARLDPAALMPEVTPGPPAYSVHPLSSVSQAPRQRAPGERGSSARPDRGFATPSPSVAPMRAPIPRADGAAIQVVQPDRRRSRGPGVLNPPMSEKTIEVERQHGMSVASGAYEPPPPSGGGASMRQSISGMAFPANTSLDYRSVTETAPDGTISQTEVLSIKSGSSRHSRRVRRIDDGIERKRKVDKPFLTWLAS